MKKHKKKEIISIVLSIIVLSALGLGIQQIISHTYEKNDEARKELAAELGYVPGLLIIKQKGSFNVRSKEGLNEFKNFLKKESRALTPIILKKLVANGKLQESEINADLINTLEKNLITYNKYKGNGYEIHLTVAINNAVIEVAEELVKEDEIVQAYKNGIGMWFAD